MSAQPPGPPQLSADGKFYWDGQRWVPTLSADGQWRWDGARWNPAQAAGPPSQQLAPQSAFPPYAQPPNTVQYANAVMVYKSPTNTAALVSLIFGIVSWFLCPLVGGIVAVISGHMAHGQIKRSGESGAGMATAGMVLGYIHLAGAAVFLLFWLVVFGGLAALLGAIGATNH